MDNKSTSSSTTTTAINTITLDSFLSSIYKHIHSEIHNQQTIKLNDSANKESSLPQFNAVLGNEAGDADSIISSIALSYVLQLKQQEIPNDNNNSPCWYSFPIISIPRKDMKLRRDVTLLLSLCQLSSLYTKYECIYIDDIINQVETSKDDTVFSAICRSLFHMQDDNIPTNNNHENINTDTSTSSQPSLHLTLVDHNKLRSSLWHLHHYVDQIWDHHWDEGYHRNSQVRNIAFDSVNMTALVGSTCTLVTEELQRVLSFVSNGEKGSIPNSHIDPALSLALLGVILMDTMNMNIEAGKGTYRDQHAIDFLIQHTNWESFVASSSSQYKDGEIQLKPYYNRIFEISSESDIECNLKHSVLPNRTALYEILRDCKLDPQFWLEMSIEEALRMDYKTFHSSQESSFTFGLSSVLLPYSTLQEKDNFQSSVFDFIQSQQIQCLGILSLVLENDVPRREISIVGPKDIVQSLTRYFITSEDASFLALSVPKDKKPKAINGDTCDCDFIITTLQQGNSKASRKQIAPVIQSFASKL